MVDAAPARHRSSAAPLGERRGRQVGPAPEIQAGIRIASALVEHSRRECPECPVHSRHRIAFRLYWLLLSTRIGVASVPVTLHTCGGARIFHQTMATRILNGER